MSAEDKYPPFQLGKPRFDQSTFSGRLRHFLDVVDPRTLFTREEALQASVQLLDQYKQGSLGPSITNKQVCSFPVYISVVNMFMATN
jgi:hypothetical protein